MIMDGLEFTGQVPFSTVYLHGLVRNEEGQKMSKSKGTGVDPLPLMAEFGTDALRFTLLVGSTPGNDTNLSVKKVEGNRNFANKIWNAGRFVVSAINNQKPASGERTGWTLADSWIWAKLEQTVREVERLFQTYQYGEAGRQIYEFFWNDFADWYVEVAKQQLAAGGGQAYLTAQTLAQVLDTSLRLLHPITPFVTEELWGHLRKALQASPLKDLAADWPNALIVAGWPEAGSEEGWEGGKVADFSQVQEVVRTIRNLRAERKVGPAKRLPATIVGGIKKELLQEQAKVITTLAGLDEKQVTILASLASRPVNSVALVAGTVEIYLPLSGMVDQEEQRGRFMKELSDIQVQIDRLNKLLESDFASKAPAAVVQKEREKLAEFQQTAEKLRALLS
jgi:valyl-tRNA synthetase